MLVFAYVVRSTGPDAFDFAIDGAAVATNQLPSLQLISGPDPMPLTTAPKRRRPDPWGIRSFLNPADGTVYLYGTTKYSIGIFGTAADAWLARAPFNNPDAAGVLHQSARRPYVQHQLRQRQADDFHRAPSPDKRSDVGVFEQNSPQGPWQMVMNGTDPQTVATFHNQRPTTKSPTPTDARWPGRSLDISSSPTRTPGGTS
jgi:hypothetical protein